MYQIINVDNGNTIGYTEKVRYIKKSQNGSFIQAASPDDALGIAYLNKPYNLYNTEGLGLEDTAMVMYVDQGQLLNHIDTLLQTVSNIEDTLCELDKEVEE